MVNGPMHEWESDSGTESGHDQASGLSEMDASAGAAFRREAQRELSDAVPALRRLARNKTVAPSAAQWTAFSRGLSARLDAENSSSKRRCWRSMRDCLKATDSKAVRTGAAAAFTAAVAALLAALIWLAAHFAPAPAAAAAYFSPRHAVPCFVSV